MRAACCGSKGSRSDYPNEQEHAIYAVGACSCHLQRAHKTLLQRQPQQLSPIAAIMNQTFNVLILRSCSWNS